MPKEIISGQEVMVWVIRYSTLLQGRAKITILSATAINIGDINFEDISKDMSKIEIIESIKDSIIKEKPITKIDTDFKIKFLIDELK